MKQGYVIAKNKAAAEFFTSASSYDRPKWVALSESKVYLSIELAERAARKICTYGAYEARLVPLAELEDMDELPPNGGKKEMVANVQGSDEPEVHDGDEDDGVESDVDARLGIEDNRADVDASVDADDKEDTLEGGDVKLGEEALTELSTATLKAYSHKAGPSLQNLRKSSEDGDPAAADKRLVRRKSAARALDKIRQGTNESEQLDELSIATLRSYADKASEKLHADHNKRNGAPVTDDNEFNKRAKRISAIFKADSDADDKEEIEHSINRGREDHARPGYVHESNDAVEKRQKRKQLEREMLKIESQREKVKHSDKSKYQELGQQFDNLRQQWWQLKESDTMPAKPPLDAQPSENKNTAMDLPKTPTIKYKDTASDQEDLNKSGAYAPDAKVKLPSNVKSDLVAVINAFKKTADYSNKIDDAKASFAMTVYAAFEDLLNCLEQETAEGIKAAQIKMTSWMNPITSHLPVSVQKFVQMGGRKQTLQDLFDAKRAADKE